MLRYAFRRRVKKPLTAALARKAVDAKAANAWQIP
jgi:hypothetical protein